MPSRRAIALIVAFWVTSTAYVAYRDLWPRLFGSGPPAVGIDLADEAAQNVPIHWQVLWNDKPVGQLRTQMSYEASDDTFWFTNVYRNLQIEIAGARLYVPEFKTAIRVTRGGHLLEQSAEGNLNLMVGEQTVGTVHAKVAGTVVDGKLVASFEGGYEFRDRTENVNRQFDPVPVPTGQPLNPLQPVNRLVGIRPDREWVVHESNPLNDALLAVAGELGVKPQKNDAPLVGRVQEDPRLLDWHNERVECWVIEYRREGELQVRTWVRVADGRVLKQEAFSRGETLSIEREE